MMGSDCVAGSGRKHEASKQGSALRVCLTALMLFMAFGSGCTMSHQTVVGGPEYTGLDAARGRLSLVQQTQQKAKELSLRESAQTK